MSQSLVKNYMHLVFSTRQRYPFIKEHIEKDLHKYIGGICNHLHCPSMVVGGYHDHVHILFNLSKNINLAKFVQELKSHSSKWVKTLGEQYKNFYWQKGYGGFSVVSEGIEPLRDYINNQHEHHQKITFQDEYRKFLRDNELEWDERYVWD